MFRTVKVKVREIYSWFKKMPQYPNLEQFVFVLYHFKYKHDYIIIQW